jgi:hypothetical protein
MARIVLKVAGCGSVGLCGWPAYRKYNPVVSGPLYPEVLGRRNGHSQQGVVLCRMELTKISVGMINKI